MEAPQGTGGNYIIARVTGIAHPQTAGARSFMRLARQNYPQQAAADFSTALANATRLQARRRGQSEIAAAGHRRRIVTPP